MPSRPGRRKTAAVQWPNPNFDLPALPRQTRSSRILTAVNMHRSREPKRIGLPFAVTKEEIDNIINAELRRMYVLEGKTLRQIEAESPIGFGFAGKRLQQILTPEERRTVRLHAILRHTNGTKLKFAGTGQLTDYMVKNGWRERADIAKELGVDGKAVTELKKVLGIEEKTKPDRHRIQRRELLKWTIGEKKADPRRLSWTYLYNNNRPMLSQIMTLFSAEPKEANRNSRAIYDRFLVAMGLTPEMVGTANARPRRKPAEAIPEKKGAAKARAEIVKAGGRKGKGEAPEFSPEIEKQRALLVGLKNPAPFTELRSLKVSNAALSSMLEEGTVIRAFVGGKPYYHRPGQEKQLKNIRKKATIKALQEFEETGETDFRFGPEECKVAALARMDKAMLVNELIAIGRDRFTATTTMKEALEALKKEGLVKEYAFSHGRSCWYKPGQEKSLGRFERQSIRGHGHRQARPV
ncbi:MAG: hypothetical protein V1493_04130 [Candidatus Diapherotrites archaeon]